MTTNNIENALWSAAQAEKRLGLLLTQLDKLRPQLPADFDATVMPLLDEFYAVYHLVKTLKYDLMCAARNR